MRKKLLWLLVLPVLLCGAIFWARDAAWSRMETDFRREIGSNNLLYVSYKETTFGILQGPELRQVISWLHLEPRKSQPKSGNAVWMQLDFVTPKSSREAVGIFLRWDANENNVGADSSLFDSRWGRFQLTSQSRADVLNFIWRKWGTKLHSKYDEGVVNPPIIR